MYKETIRSIAGIGVFPVVSLLLFVVVFVIAVVRAARMEQAVAAHLASLPLEGGDAVTVSLEARRQHRHGRGGISGQSVPVDEPARQGS